MCHNIHVFVEFPGFKYKPINFEIQNAFYSIDELLETV